MMLKRCCKQISVKSCCAEAVSETTVTKNKQCVNNRKCNDNLSGTKIVKIPIEMFLNTDYEM